MKRISVILTAFIIVLILCIYSNIYINNSASELLTHITKTENLVAQKNWNAAYSEFQLFKDLWEKRKGSWAALIEHSEIDNIEISSKKLDMYIQIKDPAESLAESSALRNLVEHIPEIHWLVWKNIL